MATTLPQLLAAAKTHLSLARRCVEQAVAIAEAHPEQLKPTSNGKRPRKRAA